MVSGEEVVSYLVLIPYVERKWCRTSYPFPYKGTTYDDHDTVLRGVLRPRR